MRFLCFVLALLNLLQGNVLQGNVLQGNLLYNNVLSNNSFFNQHSQGWHWYEQAAAVPAAAMSTSVSASVQIANYRRDLEEKLSRALLEPTAHNIKAYIVVQKELMDRSKLFSETWLKTIFTNPQLDHTLISPVNQKARHLQIAQQKQQTFKMIKELAKEYGLFFFFRGACEYCHQFAPIVKQFAQTYGFSVLAISDDGGQLEAFPNSIKDNGLMQQWQVEILPTLFAIHPQLGRVIPIAYGLTSIEEMENRMIKLKDQH